MALVNKTKGNTDKVLQELKDKWYKLGGDWDLLIKTAENGAKKNPLFCGKKCKTALAKNDYKKSFDGNSIDNIEFDNYSYVAIYDDVAIGTWIALGTAVLSAMATITSKAIENKTEKAKIESAELIAKNELASLDAKTKLEADLKEKEIASSVDPKNAIVTNPDLTAQEKSLALKQLDEATTKETSQNFKKFALYGIVGVGVIYLLTKVMKNK